MKKLVLLFTALGLVMTSCSSDDGDSSSSTGTLLTKIIETYDDGTVETYIIEYNGNKVSRMYWDSSLQDETIFTYTGDLITKEEYFFDDGDYSFEETTVFEYDANERLIKSTRNDGGDVYVDSFTYNTNNTITFSTTLNDELYANGTIYLNNAGEPYKKEYVKEFESSFTIIEENTFDTMNNPFFNITGFSKINIAVPTYQRGYEGNSNNNLTTIENGLVLEQSTYTYNSDNYPVTEVYIDQNSDYNSTSQYIYN